jgi:8-oxo-dGTP diphosphatase
MKHRIRAAALITKNDSILLVQHVHPVSGEEWWVPPGGGVEPEDASLFDCVRREVFEETGLQVELTSVVYLREFIDQENQARNLELFVGSNGFSGELTIRHVQGSGPDEHYIRNVRWVRRAEIGDMVVYPEILKDGFWTDLAEGFPRTKYLGVQKG